MKQTSFEQLSSKPKDIFGGSLLTSHPKVKRPLDSKFPIHVVLRANQSGMRRPAVYGRIYRAIHQICKKHGVTLYREVNVGNHIHLLIKLSRRPRWAGFIRELTGRVAQIAQGLVGREKADARFWKYRPYTRIVRSWNKAFRLLKEYLELNRLETEGHIKRSEVPTLKALRQLLQIERASGSRNYLASPST